MKTISYKAFAGMPEKIAPDDYITALDGPVKRPLPDFVISRNATGKVVSKYSDDIWDMTPYRLAGDTGSVKLYFNKMSSCSISDAKWLMFILMFMADSGRSTGLSVSTILGYMKPVRLIEKYTISNEIGLLDIFGNKEHLTSFIRSVNVRNPLHGLASVILHLQTIGNKRTGIKVVGGDSIQEIKKKLSLMDVDKQHPVIPPRIYSEVVMQINQFIETVYSQKHNLEVFLSEIVRDKQFARSASQQSALGYKVAEYAEFFEASARRFGLSEMFYLFNVNNLPKLSVFLTRITHACRLMVYIYSGMRNSEALSLKIGCLKEDVSFGRVSFRLYGETSKLIGQKKEVSWVTSKELKRTIDLAEMLASIIGKCKGLAANETPLFISTGYLSFTTSLNFEKDGLTVSRAGSKSQEVFKYLDLTKFKIEKEDFDHLEKVDSFRAWGSEQAFQVGATWRFTTHQFRRSLAFYVSQSSLVSLPSLKRQLKHISREMTIYYCQATETSELFNQDQHISKLVREVKPEADATAYLHDIFLEEEPLWGAHGRFIENHNKSEENVKIYTEQRDDLVRQFRKGELAYKATPLGACTTIEPCDKKAAREIVACISCDKAIIKLSKLDRVIERQSMLVEEFKVLDEHSVEYRTESAELTALMKFKNRVILKDTRI